MNVSGVRFDSQSLTIQRGLGGLGGILPDASTCGTNIIVGSLNRNLIYHGLDLGHTYAARLQGLAKNKEDAGESVGEREIILPPPENIGVTEELIPLIPLAPTTFEAAPPVDRNNIPREVDFNGFHSRLTQVMREHTGNFFAANPRDLRYRSFLRLTFTIHANYDSDGFVERSMIGPTNFRPANQDNVEQVRTRPRNSGDVAPRLRLALCNALSQVRMHLVEPLIRSIEVIISFDGSREPQLIAYYIVYYNFRFAFPEPPPVSVPDAGPDAAPELPPEQPEGHAHIEFSDEGDGGVEPDAQATSDAL